MTGDSDNGSVTTSSSQASGRSADSDDEPQQHQTLTESIGYLGQTVRSLLQQLTNIETLVPVGELIVTEAPTIRMVNDLADDNIFVSLALKSAATQMMFTQITSLKNIKTTNTWDLLEHFDGTIKAIVKRFVSQPCDADTMWRIVEECCIQAVPSGQLGPCVYLATRAGLSDQMKHDRCVAWARFWAATLNSCPDGPTLFIPPRLCSQSETSQSPPGDLPRFLFRVYDPDSPAINNEDTIASWGHLTYGPIHSKRDILSLSQDIASRMLYRHLNGAFHRSTDADNLVSWSSSLLYAIKSANYRSVAHTNVAICILDTTKFPKSQFVSADWLCQRYGEKHLDMSERAHRENRLRNAQFSKYNNGEYLSQGKLNITGRSCTVLITMLHTLGIGTFYEELDIELVKHADWSSPVRKIEAIDRHVVQLGEKWRVDCTTTSQEIQHAMRIAQGCLGYSGKSDFACDESDLALMILAFRQRKTEGAGDEEPSLSREPVEVVRYMALKRKLEQLRAKKPLDTVAALEELFVLNLTSASVCEMGYQRYEKPMEG